MSQTQKGSEVTFAAAPPRLSWGLAVWTLWHLTPLEQLQGVGAALADRARVRPDAGAIDQDARRAVHRRRLGQRCRHLGVAGDVGGRRAATDLGRGFAHRIGIDVEQGHPGARLGQDRRRAGAKPRCTAGDDGGQAGNVHRACPVVQSPEDCPVPPRRATGRRRGGSAMSGGDPLSWRRHGNKKGLELKWRNIGMSRSPAARRLAASP